MQHRTPNPRTTAKSAREEQMEILTAVTGMFFVGIH